MRLLVICSAIALSCAFTSPAQACHNEPRTSVEERQFRSQYQRKNKSKAETVNALVRDQREFAVGLSVSVVGALLLMGSLRQAMKPTEAK